MQSSNGFYYAYDGDAGNWPIHRSEDGVYWERLGNGGEAYPQGTWGQRNFWVPEVIENNGRYYMFYCAREDYDTRSSRIGVAISDSPEGPFIDTGIPLFDGTEMEDWHVIDPNPFIDPDSGKKYLYFVKDGALYTYWNDDLNKEIGESRIYGVQLSDDMLSVEGEARLLLRPSQQWEYKSHLLNGRKLWNEAPQILKKEGVYYLMYSANFFKTEHYAVGYATSQAPLGVYEKDENNPVIGSVGNIKKAGHNSVIRSRDGSEYFTSYSTLGDGRYLSRIGFRKNGSLYVNGPVKGYQVMPGGTTDYVNYAEEAEISTSSTKALYETEAITDGEIGIYERYEGYEWSSDGEREGAWVQLHWEKSQKVELILIYTSALQSRKVQKGQVTLNGDTKQTISDINIPADPGEPAIIRFPKGMKISSLKFEVTGLQSSEGISGMSEIMVLGKK
nr:glycoside hydrolase family 43 protein [Sinomicrobium weinanense]